MSKLGQHIIVEFYGSSENLLNDVIHIEQSMVQAAKEANATVINSTFHHFSPFGVSGVVVIQESHLAIHTWPEFGYSAVDIFTCGETVNPWVCYKYLKDALGASYGSAIEMNRGQLSLLDREVNTKWDENYGENSPKPPTVNARNIWFTERNENIALSLRHKGDTLYRQESPFQKVEVYDTYAYGKLLTLDGMVMTTEKDEYVYHEMITHVPLLVHPNPKRVLVIGGGDGGAVREILRHKGVQEAVMVEIDNLVIEASKEHLPDIASALINPDPRLTLLVDDGIAYVKNAPDASFDVVIVDSTDPVGPAEGLFSEAFYKEVYRILTPDGIMITQSESPRFNVNVFQEIYACYRGIFGQNNVHCYLIQVPTYPSGTWSLAFSSKGNLHPVKNFDAARAEAICAANDLQYYNPQLHQAAFALPNYVKKLTGTTL